MAKRIFFHLLILVSVIAILIAANRNYAHCYSIAKWQQIPEEAYYIIHYHQFNFIKKSVSIAMVFNFSLYIINSVLHFLVFRRTYNKYLLILLILGLILVGGFGIAGCYDPRKIINFCRSHY